MNSRSGDHSAIPAGCRVREKHAELVHELRRHLEIRGDLVIAEILVAKLVKDPLASSTVRRRLVAGG